MGAMSGLSGRRKPGPVPKGDRSQFTIRVPADHRPVLEKAAKEAGLPLGDYVAVVLAAKHDLPIPAYVNRDKGQEALPISA